MDKKEILKLIKEVDSDFVVSSSGLNRIKQYVSALTGEQFEYCDLVFTGNGKQYILKTTNDVFRASYKNDILTITSDNKNGEVIFKFE